MICTVWVNQEISKPLASKNIGFLYCYGRWTFKVMKSKTELISHVTNISESHCNINKVETQETLESPHNRSFVILVSCGFMLMLSIKTAQNQSVITEENAINLNLWTFCFSIFKHKFLQSQYQQRIIATKKDASCRRIVRWSGLVSACFQTTGNKEKHGGRRHLLSEAPLKWPGVNKQPCQETCKPQYLLSSNLHSKIVRTSLS